jgi:hypothetical protein
MGISKYQAKLRTPWLESQSHILTGIWMIQPAPDPVIGRVTCLADVSDLTRRDPGQAIDFSPGIDYPQTNTADREIGRTP